MRCERLHAHGVHGYSKYMHAWPVRSKVCWLGGNLIQIKTVLCSAPGVVGALHTNKFGQGQVCRQEHTIIKWRDVRNLREQ